MAKSYEYTPFQTTIMAAHALRSAADDLGKTGTTRTFNLSMTGRIIATSLAEDHPVSLVELGFLVKELAQVLERNAPYV